MGGEHDIRKIIIGGCSYCFLKNKCQILSDIPLELKQGIFCVNYVEQREINNDIYLANPLQYYNSDTVDVFLIALANSYTCNTIVYRCTEKDTWTTNISNPEKHYTKTLYFAMSDKDHVDLVLTTDDQRVESDHGLLKTME